MKILSFLFCLFMVACSVKEEDPAWTIIIKAYVLESINGEPQEYPRGSYVRKMFVGEETFFFHYKALRCLYSKRSITNPDMIIDAYLSCSLFGNNTDTRSIVATIQPCEKGSMAFLDIESNPLILYHIYLLPSCINSEE